MADKQIEPQEPPVQKPEEYVFTAEQQALLADYRQAQRDLENQIIGVLSSIRRWAGLKGQWQFNGQDRFIKVG